MKCNCDASLKTDDAQSAQQIIALCAAFRKVRKPSAENFNTFDVSHRNRIAGAIRDEKIELSQIVARFRRKDYPIRHWAVFAR